MYKLQAYPFTETVAFVCHIPTNTIIPFDTSHKEYRDYLKWVEEGNTPEPADILTLQVPPAPQGE